MNYSVKLFGSFRVYMIKQNLNTIQIFASFFFFFFKQAFSPLFNDIIRSNSYERFLSITIHFSLYANKNLIALKPSSWNTFLIRFNSQNSCSKLFIIVIVALNHKWKPRFKDRPIRFYICLWIIQLIT